MLEVKKYRHPISATRRKLRNKCKGDLLIFGFGVAVIVSVILIFGGC